MDAGTSHFTESFEPVPVPMHPDPLQTHFLIAPWHWLSVVQLVQLWLLSQGPPCGQV